MTGPKPCRAGHQYKGLNSRTDAVLHAPPPPPPKGLLAGRWPPLGLQRLQLICLQTAMEVK